MPDTPRPHPDITRPDAGTVLLSVRHTDGPHRQRALADAAFSAWSRLPHPPGLLSLSLFLGVDGHGVLAHSQWRDDDAYAAHARTHGPGLFPGTDVPQDLDRAAPVRFRLYRSTGPGRGGRTPGCVATPSFDTDGPERQRAIVDRLVDGPLDRPLPGLLAAHFHLSTDGTRVVNYAEWTTEELHERSLTGAVLGDAGAITRDMPGVRGIGCPRYLLHRSLGTDPHGGQQ
ncbi:monooxygenase [Streptomyces xanthochromogenes]|uniref:monooxygenase n=1 Tax=Streptomyces xanthochromogenes TaxID=67384 RepID=UPI0034464F6C